jgi:hypothetical protein
LLMLKRVPTAVDQQHITRRRIDGGIESDDVVHYCFPVEWPADRERRARYIDEWLKTEVRYLGS